MTSSKRPIELSLDHINTIDKNLCLSSYKLRSKSKIGSNLLDSQNNLRGASLIFDNSEEGNSQLKKGSRSPLSPLMNDREIYKASKNKINFQTQTTSGKDKSWHQEVDSNELFENFDDLIQVKFSSQTKIQIFDHFSDLKSISKDLNNDLAIESEKGYWAVAGVKPPKESFENPLNNYQSNELPLYKLVEDPDSNANFQGEISTGTDHSYYAANKNENFPSFRQSKLHFGDSNCLKQIPNHSNENRKMNINNKENYCVNDEVNHLFKTSHDHFSGNNIKNQTSLHQEKLGQLDIQFLEARSTVLKNDKNFPEAPKHSESGIKKLKFSPRVI